MYRASTTDGSKVNLSGGLTTFSDQSSPDIPPVATVKPGEVRHLNSSFRGSDLLVMFRPSKSNVSVRAKHYYMRSLIGSCTAPSECSGGQVVNNDSTFALNSIGSMDAANMAFSK